MKKSGWRSAQARRTNGMMPAEVPNEPSAFAILLQSEGLKATEAHKSPRVKAWVKKHRWSRYVPEDVLAQFDWREPC